MIDFRRSSENFFLIFGPSGNCQTTTNHRFSKDQELPRNPLGISITCHGKSPLNSQDFHRIPLSSPEFTRYTQESPQIPGKLGGAISCEYLSSINKDWGFTWEMKLSKPGKLPKLVRAQNTFEQMSIALHGRHLLWVNLVEQRKGAGLRG